MPKLNRVASVLFAALAFLAATPASAHVIGSMSGVGAGLVHPLIGLDHLLALLSVGVFAGVQGGKWSFALPVLFTLCLVLGAVMGLGAPASGIIQPAVCGALIVFGLAVIWPDLLRPFTMTGLAVCFAIVHGFSHGAALPVGGPVTGTPGFILGMAVTSLALSLAASRLIALPAVRLRSPIFGASFAVAGFVMLVPSL